MIYGKTFQECWSEKYKRMQEEVDNAKKGITRFAYFPITLKNGQKLWWDYYIAYYDPPKYDNFSTVWGELGNSMWWYNEPIKDFNDSKNNA